MFDPDPLIVAHRGAPKVAPENTLASFRAARTAGADLYELDVHLTKDGHLVVMHDSSLARTTNVEQLFPDRTPWRVRDFTLAEISRLDAGSWFNKKFTGERVPTLQGVLQAMKGGPGLLLEVKHPSRTPGISERVSAILPQTPPVTIVQSFDWQFVKKLQGRGERAVLGVPLISELPDISRYAGYVSVKHPTITAAYVRKAHSLGLKVLAYTVNTPAKMHRVLLAGVDGLITNRPKVLRRALESNVCFTAPSELMAVLAKSQLLNGKPLCPAPHRLPKQPMVPATATPKIQPPGTTPLSPASPEPTGPTPEPTPGSHVATTPEPTPRSRPATTPEPTPGSYPAITPGLPRS